MAGSEGSVSGQTDLLTGWSSVVHRPSEDPEPSSLPSTVDITAFSSGPNVEPTQPNNNCCSNSDSETGSDSEVNTVIDNDLNTLISPQMTFQTILPRNDSWVT